MMGSLMGWARYAVSLHINLELYDGAKINMRKSLNNPFIDRFGHDADVNDPDYFRQIWWIGSDNATQASDWTRIPIKDLDKKAWLQKLEPCKTLDDAKRVLGL